MSVLDRDRMSMAEAARRVSARVATIWRWADRGVRGRMLPTVMVGGRRYVLRAELEWFLDGGGAGGGGGATAPMVAPPSWRPRRRRGVTDVRGVTGVADLHEEHEMIRSNDAGPQEYPRPPVLAEDGEDAHVWDDDAPAVENYAALGQRLAQCGDLYRRPQYGGGLLLASPSPKVPPIPIVQGAHLAPIIVDRVKVVVVKGGKPKGSSIATHHLNTMLATETFLQQFTTIDAVTTTPMYVGDHFALTVPGRNDAGPGQRIYYAGPAAEIAESTEMIERFLNVMAFASDADRANTVAAALTVMMRNHWPGGKPLIAVTATKSHAGKDTVVAFASGSSRITSVSYQSTDWALERALVGAVKHSPDTAVINVENARLDRGTSFVASGFLERLIMDAEPTLFATGSGGPTRRRNDLVVATTTNEGSLSADLMNRALPIRLAPTGNIEDREPEIGNPKLEFLPANRERIEAEIRGMIERWREAGMPLDEQVRHPFSEWARVIGGILQVSGFSDFLANYTTRKAVDDPLRRSLGILGAARPEQWLTASAWAQLIAEVGLTQAIIPAADRESEQGRARGAGVVLKPHIDETFIGETEDEQMTLRLERARRRFEEGRVSTRYRFVVVDRQTIPADDDPVGG